MKINNNLKKNTNKRKWILWGLACCSKIWENIELIECQDVFYAIHNFVSKNLTYKDIKPFSKKVKTKLQEIQDACILDIPTLQQDMENIDTLLILRNIFELCDPEQITIREQLVQDIAKNIHYLYHKNTPKNKNKILIASILLKEIFFHPHKSIPTLQKEWINKTTKCVANYIYNNQSFEDMPILGDALEEAGCNNADILNHCRTDNEHVKGCWVLDSILVGD